MGNMCMSSMAAAQAKAEEGVRAAGGGDMLDKAKEKAADGVPIGFGKTVDIPDLATKGGECHVGVKYTCKAGKTVDAPLPSSYSSRVSTLSIIGTTVKPYSTVGSHKSVLLKNTTVT